MNHQRAEAVGDVMLLLHLRLRGEETRLLEAATVRFARVSRNDGAAILDIVDELHTAPIALCMNGYDRVHA